MRRVLFLCLALSIIAPCYAQTDDTKPTRKLEHHVGLQANLLIQQIFNFNSFGGGAGQRNPYLLTYNVNSVRSGWGARIGVGYNSTQSASGDITYEQSTKDRQLNLRLGVEKRFVISPRFSAGVGIDALYADGGNDVNTFSGISSDTITTFRTTTTRGLGAGPMGWLRYRFTRNISIGTEASWYTYQNTLSWESTQTRRDNTLPGRPYTTKTDKNEYDLKESAINLPIAFYLIVQL